MCVYGGAYCSLHAKEYDRSDSPSMRAAMTMMMIRVFAIMGSLIGVVVTGVSAQTKAAILSQGIRAVDASHAVGR